MKFVSTRGKAPAVTIRQALEAGLAPDGGLYVPENFPVYSIADFDDLDSLPQVATRLLAPFFQGDETLSLKLESICKSTFDFPIPLTAVPGRPGDFILELFHGPTSAFKDIGARFLANCIDALEAVNLNKKQKTVIVATSGDTGGAVAAAFFQKPNIEVVILFPKGKISPRQQKQLCAWGENVRAFAVEGVFDDCQRMVKEALLDASSDRIFLSANSINLGRILPQKVYYAYASLQLAKMNLAGHELPKFIIPSGNLGNSVAALWAKKIGLPIGEICLSLNANRGVAEYLHSGLLPATKTIATLANAMDVSIPSNLERVRALYPDQKNLIKVVSAESVSDAEISSEIKLSEQEWGQVLCPHSATAAVVRKRHPVGGTWVLVATAHPAKFETIVEPLIGHSLKVPIALQEILKRPSLEKTIAATYESLKIALAE